MTKMTIEVELNERYQRIGNISKGTLLDELMYLRDKGYIDDYKILQEYSDMKDDEEEDDDYEED